MPASEAALAREWSRLHAGLNPARVPLLRPWLRAMWALAGPLVTARVPPLALTALGPILALGALAAAGSLPVLALVLVLLAVLCDGLDGAVALLSGRATALGSVADKIADRIADCALALVIWRCGAPLGLAVAAGALSLAHEGWRAYRGAPLTARITANERPTRVICTLLACLCASVGGANWPATVCAAVWAGLAVLALAQLAGRGRVPARPLVP